MNVDLLAKCALMIEWRRFVDGLFWMLHHGDKKRYKYCLSKKRTQAAGQPASDVLMNSDGSAQSQEIFTHAKYTFDQNFF